MRCAQKSMYIDSDQENSHSNSTMSKKTSQDRKLTYRNLLNKVEILRKNLNIYLDLFVVLH